MAVRKNLCSRPNENVRKWTEPVSPGSNYPQLDADRELWAAPCWQTPIALEAEKKLNLQWRPCRRTKGRVRAKFTDISLRFTVPHTRNSCIGKHPV